MYWNLMPTDNLNKTACYLVRKRTNLELKKQSKLKKYLKSKASAQN